MQTTKWNLHRRLRGCALASLALMAAACAGEDDDVAQFTGAWTITQGEITVACPGAQAFTLDPVGSVFENVALDGGRFRHSDPAGCVLDFTTDGDRAEMVPGQTCTATDAMGQMHTEAKQSLVFEITGDGVLEANGSGVSDGVCMSTLHAVAVRDQGDP